MGAAEVIEALSRTKFDLSYEHLTQSQIEFALRKTGIPFEREAWIAERDRVDFLCEGGVAIEVKVRGVPRQFYRQVERYCDSDKVKELILATGRATSMPRAIGGKPVYVFSLSKALL